MTSFDYTLGVILKFHAHWRRNSTKSNSTSIPAWTNWTDVRTLCLKFIERPILTHPTRSTSLSTFSWCNISSNCHSRR